MELPSLAAGPPGKRGSVDPAAQPHKEHFGRGCLNTHDPVNSLNTVHEFGLSRIPPTMVLMWHVPQKDQTSSVDWFPPKAQRSSVVHKLVATWASAHQQGAAAKSRIFL